MQRFVDGNSQCHQANGDYELIYDIKRSYRSVPTANRPNSNSEEYQRPNSLKEMKADLTRALQTILSEDIIDLGIR